MDQTLVTWFRLPASRVGAVLVLLMLAVPVFAQGPGGPPGTPRNDPNDPINQEKTNKADMKNREWLMGNSRKPIRRAALGPEAAALPQIAEDFEKIQLVEKDLITAVFAKNILDRKQVVKASADIEKRASRLLSNLAYPEPTESETPPKVEENDLRLMLTKLDGAIMSFVSNPIFQSDRQVVNAELAMRVTRDLRAVVKLSGSVRRQAALLGQQQSQP